MPERLGHVKTSPYKHEQSHVPGILGLRLGVSTQACEPGYRVEDWTWEARRVRSSVRQG